MNDARKIVIFDRAGEFSTVSANVSSLGQIRTVRHNGISPLSAKRKEISAFVATAWHGSC